MDIHPIRNDEDLSKAIAAIEDMWGADKGTPEGDKLDVLITLVDRYEDEHYPISSAHPIEVIKLHMEMTEKSQRDLALLIGSASRASEVLNKRRALTLDMVDKLNGSWGIPAECLIKPYPLERKKLTHGPRRSRALSSSRPPLKVKKRA